MNLASLQIEGVTSHGRCHRGSSAHRESRHTTGREAIKIGFFLYRLLETSWTKWPIAWNLGADNGGNPRHHSSCVSPRPCCLPVPLEELNREKLTARRVLLFFLNYDPPQCGFRDQR